MRLLREDRRLVLLLLLDKAPGSESNHYLLREALGVKGHNTSHDIVAAELVWLEEQGLVTLEKLENMYIATLTARGHDAANGRCAIPGVKKPIPGE